MNKTLTVLNELERKGIIERYAIGGAVGAIFYTEPITTYDADVFILLPAEKQRLTPLSPIYDYLRRKGYREERENLLIEGIPVRFIPAYNPLVEEAVRKAKEVKYKRVRTRILTAEYLVAIMIHTGRPKDKARIALMFEEARIDPNKLRGILQRHGLTEKWRRLKEEIYAA